MCLAEAYGDLKEEFQNFKAETRNKIEGLVKNEVIKIREELEALMRDNIECAQLMRCVAYVDFGRKQGFSEDVLSPYMENCAKEADNHPRDRCDVRAFSQQFAKHYKVYEAGRHEVIRNMVRQFRLQTEFTATRAVLKEYVLIATTVQ